MVLEWREQVSSGGSLVIELEADVRQEEGRIENLQYSNGTTRYTFHWMVGHIDYHSEALDADAKCQSEGGHLVTQYATPYDEKDQIIGQAQNSRPKKSYWATSRTYPGGTEFSWETSIELLKKCLFCS